MDKCLNCGTSIEHIEGRRKKVFCGSNCRVNFNRKKVKSDFVTIPKSEYEELKVLSAKVVKTNDGVIGQFNVQINKPSAAEKSEPKYHQQDSEIKVQRNNITAQDWINEKREIDNDKDYQDWIKRLDASNLPKEIKKQIKFA